MQVDIREQIIKSLHSLDTLENWDHKGRDDGLRNAAVLLPLVKRADWHVILTKRTNHLHHHPGQVSFPGGRADAVDVTPIDTALRETEEEIGVPHGLINMVGVIEPCITVTDFNVIPLVAFVDSNYTLKIDTFEVAEVFEVPLSVLLDLSQYERKEIFWKGENRYFWEVMYNGYQIWGATAAMLYSFAERITSQQNSLG